MDQRKHTSNMVLISLIALSILFNIYIVVQMHGLREKTEHLNSLFTSQMHSIQSRISNVDRRLTGQEDAERWHSPPVVEVARWPEDNGEAKLKLNWTFRELSTDAEVGLLYQLHDGEWREAEIKQQSTLSFEALLSVSALPEAPPFMITYVSEDGPVNEQRVAAEGGSEQQASVKYKIYSDDGEQYTASDIKTLALSQSKFSKVSGVLVADIRRKKEDNEFLVELWHRGLREGEIPGISSAAVFAYGDKVELARVDMERSEERWEASISSDLESEVQYIELVVVLRDDSVAEYRFSIP